MEATNIVSSIVEAAAVLGAGAAIGAFIYKIIKWFQRQETQSADIASIKAEQCLLSYGLLACLKGLHEQGCDGPVTDAINRMEKYLNQAAHSQLPEDKKGD